VTAGVKFGDDTVLALARYFRFQWEPVQEAHVLLYPEGMVKLSGSAGEIMKRVSGSATVKSIIEDLEKTFPGVDLRNDVLGFLEVAHGNGWIRVKQGENQ
jgi:pyrroloquinoline quinone biosynthesis protein D